MKKFLFIFLIFLGTSYFFNAKAEVSLSISPQKLDLVLLPGDTFQGFFKLINHNDFVLPILAKAVPFDAREETGEMEFEKIEKDSPSFWFSFEKNEMILEPKETKRIKFKIEVPKDAAPGGYYVFVYFEPRLPSHYFEKKGPKVIPIIGVPVLISTSQVLLEPAQGNEIEVLNFSIAKKERVKILENSLNFVIEKSRISLASIGIAFAKEKPEIFITKALPDSFLLTVKNNDIYHLKPFGKIILYDLLGRKIGEGELKGQTILPKKSREFEIKISKNENFSLGQILKFVFLGKVKAQLEIKAQSPIKEEIIPLKNNFALNFFSLEFIYFIFAFVIIILIIVLLRKRLILALKFLFGKIEER